MLQARKLFIRFKNVFAKNGFQSSFYNPQIVTSGFLYSNRKQDFCEK